MRHRLALLPVVVALVTVAGGAVLTGCSFPKRKPSRRWRCSTTRSPSPSKIRWPSRTSNRRSATTPTATSKPPTSFPCPRAPTSTSSPCGWTARRPRANCSTPPRPATSTPSIVRRTQDPGLLGYIGNDLLQMKVFPIAPHSDQQRRPVLQRRAPKEGNLVEYIYPLKTDGKATATLEDFSISATHQVAARRRQRLQPDACHHSEAHQRPRN